MSKIIQNNPKNGELGELNEFFSFCQKLSKMIQKTAN